MKDQKLQTAMLVGEIQTLAYMVNEFTDYCVFFDFSGHVGMVQVRISRSKTDYSDYLASTTLYSVNKDPERSIKKLAILKSSLRKILRKNKIDYSRLNYEIEEVRHYKLV